MRLPASGRIRRAARLLRFPLLLAAIYFGNVAVQTWLGEQALAEVNLPTLTLAQAANIARHEHKLVLVDVSAIWCPTCRKLDREVFADVGVRRVIDANFAFVRLEYESPEGKAFLAQHTALGFPNLWVLDVDGAVIRKLPLTMEPQQFVEYLQEALIAQRGGNVQARS